jgi:hypothetical protein
MADVPVIVVPAAPVRLVLATLNINQFTRTCGLTLAAVDAKGEQIKGGLQVAGGESGDDYDEQVVPMLAPIVERILARMKERGQVPDAAALEVVK